MHGGSEHLNFKPNHISVMNYLYQTRGISLNGVRVYDYQRFPLPGLNESHLREGDGLGGSASLGGYLAIHFDSSGSAFEDPADQPIDWNEDGTIETNVDVTVDLNGDGFLGELLATPDEWSQLIFNGGSIGSTNTLGAAMEAARSRTMRLPFVELNAEMDRRLETLRNNAVRARAAARAQGPAALIRRPPAELNQATDRAIGNALRKGAEARPRPNQ
jgi:hypothetical protein